MEDNKIYALIAVIVVILIFTVLIFSSNNITEAVVSKDALGDGWYEDGEERFFEERMLGLRNILVLLTGLITTFTLLF